MPRRPGAEVRETASMRRRRRPAASRSSWSVGSARPRAVKKPSRARAREPIDRPGRRARSSTACGWPGCPSSSNPAQHGDHGAGAGGAVLGDEVAQPVRRLRQPGGKVGALDERAVGGDAVSYIGWYNGTRLHTGPRASSLTSYQPCPSKRGNPSWAHEKAHWSHPRRAVSRC